MNANADQKPGVEEDLIDATTRAASPVSQAKTSAAYPRAAEATASGGSLARRSRE